MVSVRREPEVPSEFWSRARGEWGSRGPDPSHVLKLNTERFLARIAWLAPACRTFGVSIEWSDQVAELVVAHRAERGRLDAVLDELQPLDDDALEARLSDSGFTRELRDFQRRDLGHLLALPHGANFSVPGAGKTAVQLATYSAERKAQRVEQMLVVAPIAAFEGWGSEAVASLESLPEIHAYSGGAIPGTAELVLVNHQRLLYSYETLAAWVAARPTLVCLDEAHRIKRGRAGEWGSTCLDLAYLAERRDVLTGTPAPQSATDLGVLLDYLWLGQGHRALPSDAFQRDPPPDLGHRIAESIEPLYARTTKTELELPPVCFEVIEVVPDRLQHEIYDALRNRYARSRTLTRAHRAQFRHMGQIVMYLLEAATNPGLLTAGSSPEDPGYFCHPPLSIGEASALADLLASYGAHETPAKFVVLAERLAANRAAGRKTLVWSNFVRNLEILRTQLSELSPAVVHGGVPSLVSNPDAPYSREGELERFRSDPDCWVLLANPAAVGEGVSLHTACHDAIYMERTFNAGQYLQSLDRIHRLGLAPGTETRVAFLIAPETIDSLVYERVEAKAVLMGEMLDDPDILTLALPDEEAFGEPVDTSDPNEIAAIFAHLRGDA